MGESIYDRLKNIVGEKNISDNFFELVNNSLDPFPYDFDLDKDVLPYAVVKPKDEKEISEIFRLANQENIAVYPRGSGTSLTGSARAPERGIILNTGRIDFLEIHTDEGYFECGPGATVDAVDTALSRKGFFLPVYPGSRLVATMGGMMAGNTSGHIIDACIGKPADYVLGLHVVLPTGGILETGSKGLRKPAGTDLTKFFVGNDGLTGIVTKIRMRLVPARKRAFGIAYYHEPESVAKAVVRMYREKAPAPLFMEFMDRATTTIGFEHAGLSVPPGCSIFFASFGPTTEIASENVQRLLDVMGKEDPIQVEEIKDLEEWLKIWTAREVIIASLMQKHDGYFSGPEIVSTLSKLVECIKELEHYGEKAPIFKGLPFYLLGHIGALTFHPTLIVPRDWDNERRRRLVDAEFEIESEMNLRYGTCGGEWLQFGKRTQFFKKRYGVGAYNLIKQIKRVFDPKDILNRGVLEGL
ncbi:MAG: FAD-binding oxidoreductase [Deltaproteobacteria bacterium]|nr:FAD-binding oxidoreductase [Deltaproteobacteria bacterium]MBW1978727.1 FAD-binding oxidoreductase [Deltaproteobacteria bacterium]MBW2045519.1 FAD-binding oxidoreductase [Deltaproteobacteria bacterium]MBW2298948.1 FAD-binding oxidoreductase [Deltaproteobacteria bacterium]